jgi:DNA-binding NtrC family response regulator
MVDDDDRVRDVSEEMSSGHDYLVITASTGRETLELSSANRESISPVILDMFMPETGGKERIRALLKMDPKVRALLVSGFTKLSVFRLIFQGFRGLTVGT